MQWGAEHIVHLLVTGPAIPWDHVHFSAVSRPTNAMPATHGLPSPKEVYLAGKELPGMLALKIQESERRENFIHLNSWGLSPLNVKIFSSPQTEAASAFCPLGQWF